MRKWCELCGGESRVHCESDQASLCWDCDGKVHGANFLVAKHVRVLLCGSCHAPTPWKASGNMLRSAVSVCEGCLGHRHGRDEVLCGEESQGGVDHHERDEDEDGENDEEEDEEEKEDLDEEEEEDGENQVVPWACNSPPPADSSSSDEFDEVSESRMKWTHQITSADSEEPECCGSCATSSRTEWATTSSDLSSRPAKRQRRVDESKQSIERNEQHLGYDKEGSRMASRTVNSMKTPRHNAVSCEDAIQGRLQSS